MPETTSAISVIPVKPARQCHLQWVKADELRVNPVAQREFRPAWANHLLQNFDLDKLQVPHVNKRPDGSLYIMEGQHSTWAYRQWLGEGQLIQVWLYNGLSEPEEAEFFLSLNDRKSIDLMSRFRSGVTAARPVDCDIDRIVRSNGCTVSHNKTDNAIPAIGTLRTIYTRHGGHVLGQTIRIVRDAFGAGGYERPILLGVAGVLARYSEQVDEQRLVEKLSAVRLGWKGVMHQARQLMDSHGSTLGEAAGAAVVEIYNRGRGGVKLMTWWSA